MGEFTNSSVIRAIREIRGLIWFGQVQFISCTRHFLVTLPPKTCYKKMMHGYATRKTADAASLAAPAEIDVALSHRNATRV